MLRRREEAVVPAGGRTPDRLAHFQGSIFCESVSVVLKYIFSPIFNKSSLPGGKVRLGRAADHSPPSSAAVVEE